MSRTITIEHNGQTYYGHLAKIDSTAITHADHGVLTAWLHTSWSGSGVGVGGYCLDQPKDRDGRDYSRVGTAYGLDYLIRVMETVGVEKWEDLPGQQVIVLFAEQNSIGLSSKGIAGVLNDKVFIPSEHAESFLGEVTA